MCIVVFYALGGIQELCGLFQNEKTAPKRNENKKNKNKLLFSYDSGGKEKNALDPSNGSKTSHTNLKHPVWNFSKNCIAIRHQLKKGYIFLINTNADPVLPSLATGRPIRRGTSLMQDY